MAKNILLHFLNKACSDLYGLSKGDVHSHVEKLVGAINAAVFLCADYCLMPPLFVAECPRAQRAVVRRMRYCQLGLIQISMREGSFPEWFGKKDDQIAEHRDQYGPILFDPNARRFILRQKDLHILHRDRVIGDEMVARWAAGPDEKGCYFNQVLESLGADAATVEEIRNIPAQIRGEGKAVTWQAINAILKEREHSPALAKLQHVVQHLYFMEYLAAHDDMTLLTGLPLARGMDFGICGGDFSHDWRILHHALEIVGCWDTINELSAESMYGLRAQSGFFAFRDMLVELGTVCRGFEDARRALSPLVSQIRSFNGRDVLLADLRKFRKKNTGRELSLPAVQAVAELLTFAGAAIAQTLGGLSLSRSPRTGLWTPQNNSVTGITPHVPGRRRPTAMLFTGWNTMNPQQGQQGEAENQPQVAAPQAHGGQGPRILAVATEWRSGHGGLSTLNRQLCCALAAAGANVVCLVLSVSDAERQAAQEVGVRLVAAPTPPGVDDPSARLSRKPALPVGFTPDFIIGHGRVTGPAADALLQDHFPGARRIHFIHMAPDEIEWFKPGRDDDAGWRAEERTEIERQLGRSAARVVAIGPRLHERARNDFHPFGIPEPIRLDPGFDVGNEAPRVPPPGKPLKVLVLGRMEDALLKGLDIAARAVGLADQRQGAMGTRLELVVRGAPAATSEQVRAQARAWAGHPGLSVVPRPFTPEAERIEEDIGRSSLVLMPSRTEGFGLVGVEAIVAGVPVLVSSASGLGELLRETLGHEHARPFVVQMTGDDNQDYDAWGRAVEAALLDRDAAFRRAEHLRGQLSQQKTWAVAVAGLLAALR